MYPFEERILDAVYTGNIELLQVLYDCDFLKPSDTFTDDKVSILHFLAKYYCPDYKYLVDTFIKNGVKLDDAMPNTPLEVAILNNNFSVALYLENHGGTYCEDELVNLEDYLQYKLSTVV